MPAVTGHRALSWGPRRRDLVSLAAPRGATSSPGWGPRPPGKLPLLFPRPQPLRLICPAVRWSVAFAIASVLWLFPPGCFFLQGQLGTPQRGPWIRSFCSSLEGKLGKDCTLTPLPDVHALVVGACVAAG